MRPFWLFTVATATSMAGNTFLYLAIPLALVHATGSGQLAVLSMAAQTAPYLVAPLIGAFIDRHERRSLFIAGELVQCGSVALIPLLLAFHEIALVFVMLAMMGLAKVVSDVAGDYGLVPALVPRERLDQASSWYNSAQLIGRFAGPVMAGLLIATTGPNWALEIDAASFLITAGTAPFLPRAGTRSDPAGPSLGTLLRAGIAYFRSRPDLQRLTAAMAVYNLGAGALEPTLLTVGTHEWRWSASSLGIAVSAGAIAAALGAWVGPFAPSGADRRHQRISVWLGVVALGSMGMLIGPPLVVVFGFCLLCFGEGGVSSTTMAYRQHEIPAELSGRVNTVIRTFITGAIPVSALLLGLTVSRSGSLLVFFPVMVGAVLSVLFWVTIGSGRRRIATRGAIKTMAQEGSM